MFSPNIPSIREMAYAAMTSKKTLAIGAVTAASAGGYLAYTGKLTPIAVATAEKASAFVSGAYALGCKGYVAAAPYAAAGYAKAAALANYSITVLTPYAAAASAKAAPYTAMIGMTPVTLSIAVGATTALVVVILIARRCLAETEENKLLQKHNNKQDFQTIKNFASSDEKGILVGLIKTYESAKDDEKEVAKNNYEVERNRILNAIDPRQDNNTES